ncbi:MAG: hypothetical protein QGD94_00855 [Planctomycetia bacterium]|nr:hypothetical protein [Planctomycetia bacterium]
MKIISLSVALVSIMVAAFASGCGQPAKAILNPMPVGEKSVKEVESVATDVMLDLGFEVERPRRSVGRVDALPLVSASIFEFWRRDTVGLKERMASTIHTIRRRAQILVSPDNGGVKVFVQVKKERKTAAGREVLTVSDTYSLYRRDKSGLTRDEKRGDAGVEWEDLGRDEALEQIILRRIRRRLP